MAENTRPIRLDLKAGTHALCTCGLSQNGQFCDGSHQGTEQSPHILKLDTDRTIYLCGCGATGNTPFCDGSHQQRNPVRGERTRRPWWRFWA